METETISADLSAFIQKECIGNEYVEGTHLARVNYPHVASNLFNFGNCVSVIQKPIFDNIIINLKLPRFEGSYGNEEQLADQFKKLFNDIEVPQPTKTYDWLKCDIRRFVKEKLASNDWYHGVFSSSPIKTIELENISQLSAIDVKNIEEIYIPPTMQSIPDGFLSGATYLKQIYFGPDKNASLLSSIGEYAFSEASALECINLPNNLVEIGDHAFEHCNVVSSLVLGTSYINYDKNTVFSSVPNSCFRIDNNELYGILDTLTEDSEPLLFLTKSNNKKMLFGAGPQPEWIRRTVHTADHGIEEKRSGISVESKIHEEATDSWNSIDIAASALQKALEKGLDGLVKVEEYGKKAWYWAFEKLGCGEDAPGPKPEYNPPEVRDLPKLPPGVKEPPPVPVKKDNPFPEPIVESPGKKPDQYLLDYPAPYEPRVAWEEECRIIKAQNDNVEATLKDWEVRNAAYTEWKEKFNKWAAYEKEFELIMEDYHKKLKEYENSIDQAAYEVYLIELKEWQKEMAAKEKYDAEYNIKLNEWKEQNKKYTDYINSVLDSIDNLFTRPIADWIVLAITDTMKWFKKTWFGKLIIDYLEGEIGEGLAIIDGILYACKSAPEFFKMSEEALYPSAIIDFSRFFSSATNTIGKKVKDAMFNAWHTDLGSTSGFWGTIWGFCKKAWNVLVDIAKDLFDYILSFKWLGDALNAAIQYLLPELLNLLRGLRYVKGKVGVNTTVSASQKITAVTETIYSRDTPVYPETDTWKCDEPYKTYHVGEKQFTISKSVDGGETAWLDSSTNGLISLGLGALLGLYTSMFGKVHKDVLATTESMKEELENQMDTRKNIWKLLETKCPESEADLHAMLAYHRWVKKEIREELGL